MTTYTAVGGQDDLQAKINALVAGDTLILSGTFEPAAQPQVAVSGTSTNRITIRGDGTARIRGADGRLGLAYGLFVTGSYILLADLLLEEAAKALVVEGASHVKVLRVTGRNCGGEIFKVRGSATYIYFDTCTAYGSGWAGANGEGFYTGLSSGSWPGGTPDANAYIRYDNCQAWDLTNDGWDTKEGSHHVVIKNCLVDFTRGRAPVTGAGQGSSGFYSRGDQTQHINCLNLGGPDDGFKLYRTEVPVGSGTYYGTNQELKGGRSVGQNTANGTTDIYGVHSNTVSTAPIKVYADFDSTGNRFNTTGGSWAGSSTTTPPYANACVDPATFTELSWTSPASAYTTPDPAPPVRLAPTPPVVLTPGASKTAAAAGSLAVPYPTGLQADDVLLLGVVNSGTGTTDALSMPANAYGWQKLYAVTGINTDACIMVYYKVATGAETGNLTISSATSQTIAGAIGILRGADRFNPIPASTNVTSTSASNTAPTPTTTNPGPQDMVMRFYMFGRAATGTPNSFTTLPTGWAQDTKQETAATTYNCGLLLVHLLAGTSTPTVTATSTAGWDVATIRVAPPPGPVFSPAPPPRRPRMRHLLVR